MRPPRSSERPAVEIGGGGVGGLTANAGTARKEGRPISIFRVEADRPRRRPQVSEPQRRLAMLGCGTAHGTPLTPPVAGRERGSPGEVQTTLCSNSNSHNLRGAERP